jgi:hypothetical protein
VGFWQSGKGAFVSNEKEPGTDGRIHGVQAIGLRKQTVYKMHCLFLLS